MAGLAWKGWCLELMARIMVLLSMCFGAMDLFVVVMLYDLMYCIKCVWVFGDCSSQQGDSPISYVGHGVDLCVIGGNVCKSEVLGSPG